VLHAVARQVRLLSLGAKRWPAKEFNLYFVETGDGSIPCACRHLKQRRRVYEISDDRIRKACGSAWSQIEPNAGQWKTWVLASGSEFRLAAPPDTNSTADEIAWLRDFITQRDDVANQQIAFWDAGSPSYRWVEMATNRIVSENIGSAPGTRIMALLDVAIYDALVAAWDSKYFYKRRRPSEIDTSLVAAVSVPRSPSYPSEHAVVAGAAAAILGYLFPADANSYTALAEECACSRLYAGVQYPSDYFAGLDLGRRVAARVIERAQTDGSDAVWKGVIPTGPGLWTGVNPSNPAAATWRTWILTSGSQLRPPPPVAYDSPQKAAELAEVKNFPRTVDTNEKAFYWNTVAEAHMSWYGIAALRIFEYHLDTNPPRAARVYALMSVAHYDSMVASWDAKYAYWALRPNQLDSTVTTLFPDPNCPGYPTFTAAMHAGIAEMLAFLFPRESDAARARADEAGMSKMWAGVYFRSDVEVGLKLGRDVAHLVIDWAVPD
jgi:hypothetical protein